MVLAHDCRSVSQVLAAQAYGFFGFAPAHGLQHSPMLRETSLSATDWCEDGVGEGAVLGVREVATI